MSEIEPPNYLVRQCQNVSDIPEDDPRKQGFLNAARKTLHAMHERGEINDAMKRRCFEILNLPT